MPKKIVQDIYVVKKSIRMIKKNDIKSDIFNVEKKVNFIKNSENEIYNNKRIPEQIVYGDGVKVMDNSKKTTKDSIIFLWIILIACLVILLFLLSSAFSTATITVTPKNQNVTLNDIYFITSDKTTSTSSLHFQVMTIKKDLSKALEPDGEEYIEKKSIGKAFIYNNSSVQKQRLTINTRLEAKNGLIYRIRDSIDVPGIQTINGVKTPGSIEVDIIADMPGDKYNMKLSDLKGDFTIPGFKGTTKYTSFYARLSADIMGGYIGNVKKVSEDKLTAGRIELKNTLTDSLIKEAYLKMPTDNILFKNNYYIQCSDLPDNLATTAYNIEEECIVNAIIFNKNELSMFIATNKIKLFDNSNVDIIWNDNTSVSLSGITAKPWNENVLKAKFTGPVKVVWSFDVNNILSEIIGQNKSVTNSIIENNKNSVLEIEATIRPIWRNTFPTNSNKIKIIDSVRDN